MSPLSQVSIDFLDHSDVPSCGALQFIGTWLPEDARGESGTKYSPGVLCLSLSSAVCPIMFLHASAMTFGGPASALCLARRPLAMVGASFSRTPSPITVVTILTDEGPGITTPLFTASRYDDHCILTISCRRAECYAGLTGFNANGDACFKASG